MDEKPSMQSDNAVMSIVSKLVRAVKAFPRLSFDFLRYVVRRYVDDGCRSSAAALTYMTLFAVVPVLTLMYSLLSIIPAFQGLGVQIESLLFDNFIPESGAEVRRYLTEFSTQARKLSVVGGIILVVTSFLMLRNIEKTFNHIWGTVGSRRGLLGFMQYWAVLTLGPFMVGVGIMMHTYLLSFQLVVAEVDTLGITGAILQYLPWLMSWMAFALLFIAMPNCRVVIRYAMIGGLVTTVLFQLAKMLFGFFITNSSYYTVYGAFAVVPVFLLWVHLSWMIVLGGAELVRALETFKSARRGHNYPDLIATLLVCWECLWRQEQGRAITDRDIVAAGIDEQHWRKLRTLLLNKKVLMMTDNSGYVLTRDANNMQLWDVVNLLGDNFATEPKEDRQALLAGYAWYPALEQRLRAVHGNAENTFTVSLKELFASGGIAMVDQQDRAKNNISAEQA
ncbi:MAG: YihY family inner membrane protein [Porticoccaceae bacterium]